MRTAFLSLTREVPRGTRPALAAMSHKGVHSPSHASHLVVPEVPLEPCNPQVALHESSNQGSKPGTSVAVGQGAPLPGNAFYITQHHHYYHYRCEHGGLGRPLPTARVGPLRLSPEPSTSCWFSWTGHPLVVASDTLLQSWTGLSLFADTPIPLLEKRKD